MPYERQKLIAAGIIRLPDPPAGRACRYRVGFASPGLPESISGSIVDLAARWLDTGPHPWGAMKRYCRSLGINYGTFTCALTQVRIRRVQPSDGPTV